MAEGKKVGSIYIDLGMKADTFSKGLAKAEGAMRSFGTKVKSGLNSLKSFIFSWRTVVIAAIAAAFTAKAIGMAIRGLKTVAKSVIEATSTYEQLRLTLNVLLKDQNKANAAFSEAEALAAKTAFSIEEITKGYTSLLTFGFEQTKIPETLLLAADAATAFGQNLDEVIRALSYLKAGRKGEALESLARFGIARTELVKRGASFSAGGELETDTEKLFEIIESIWGDTVKGMSIEGTKTWKGMISNLGDAWVKFKASIGEAGFFDAVKNALSFILAKIDEWSNNGQLKAWADDISSYLRKTFNSILLIMSKLFGFDYGNKKKILKEPKKMELEEIAYFILGFTPEEAKNAMLYFEKGEFFTGTSEADKLKAIENAQKLGEAIHAAVKGELDQGDYMTEIIPAGEVFSWAQTIADKMTGNTLGERLKEGLTSAVTEAFSDEGIITKATAFGMEIGKAVYRGVIEAWKKDHLTLYDLFGGGFAEKTTLGDFWANEKSFLNSLNEFNQR